MVQACKDGRAVCSREEEIMGYCGDTLDNGKCEKCDGRHNLCDRGLDIDTWNGLINGCPSFCYTIKEAKELQQDYEKAVTKTKEVRTN